MNKLLLSLAVFYAIVSTASAIIGDYTTAAFGFGIAALCTLVGIATTEKPKRKPILEGDIPQSAFKDAVKLKRPTNRK